MSVILNKKLPFAARAQRLNIYLLLVSLVLLAQQFTYTLYFGALDCFSLLLPCK